MNAEDLLLVITFFSTSNPPTWHKMRLGELQEFESTLSILRPIWNLVFYVSQSRVHGAETPTKNNNCWLQLWWAKGSNQRYLGKGNKLLLKIFLKVFRKILHPFHLWFPQVTLPVRPQTTPRRTTTRRTTTPLPSLYEGPPRSGRRLSNRNRNDDTILLVWSITLRFL